MQLAENNTYCHILRHLPCFKVEAREVAYFVVRACTDVAFAENLEVDTKGKGSELRPVVALESLARAIFDIKTDAVKFHLSHQVDGHGREVQIFLHLLFFMSLHKIAGLQTAIGVEVEHRANAELDISTDPMVVEKGEGETEHF